MANKDNGWPVITQIFQQAKPDQGGGLRVAWWWIWRLTIVLFTLRVIGEWF